MGIYDGVEFHPEVLAGKPPGMDPTDYMYEVSVATDYAIGFGRDRYCARVPMTRERMTKAVGYLNAANRPYSDGGEAFVWDILRDNCVHTLHNALAAAGLWKEWATGRNIVSSALDFPVPRNELVNLVRRANDLPIARPRDLFEDEAARAALTGDDWIATGPGALVEAKRMIQRNDLYATDPRLIFYDEPVVGFYQRHFDEIFRTRRYTDLKTNLAHFSRLYRDILAHRVAPSRQRPAPDFDVPLDDARFATFLADYYARVARENAATQGRLAALRDPGETPVAATVAARPASSVGAN